jgi:hypothetical protein
VRTQRVFGRDEVARADLTRLTVSTTFGVSASVNVVSKSVVMVGGDAVLEDGVRGERRLLRISVSGGTRLCNAYAAAHKSSLRFERLHT